MEVLSMGRVTVEAIIENIDDLMRAHRGEMSQEQVRRVTISDALVDTGAKRLGLPTSLVEKLGLEKFETRIAKTAVGLMPTNIYRAVWLTIEGRRCTIDVSEVHDDCSVIIGYVPLELLDFVVDPVRQRLIGDPRQGGQQILDLM